MRRRVRQGAAAGVAALALAIGGSGAAAQEDERVVRIDTLNVRDTLYHLSGGGANALALIDEINGGVVLIDAKNPGWAPAVMEAVYGVTDLPVTTIVATHPHDDSAGSLGEYPDLVEVVTHEGAAAALAGTVADTVTVTTFGDRHSLLEDLDRIELYHFGPAHTGGDTIVVFPEKGVAFLGDLFPSKATPVIDRENGGSGVAFPETLARAVASIEGVQRVITGRAPISRPRTPAAAGASRAGAAPVDGLDDLGRRGGSTRTSTATSSPPSRRPTAPARAWTRRRRRSSCPSGTATTGWSTARANVEAIYAELAAQ